jgi:signal transduction histidine kinase
MQRAVARLEGVAITVQATVGDEAEIYRNLEDTTFSGIVDEALHALSAVHDVRRVRRHIDLAHDEVQTSPAHLRVVVTCLLDNALRFAPASSLVDVTNRRTPGGFEIRIRDHGPGIVDADRLTAPFAQGDGTTTRDHQGFGLGLYAASRIVGRLGGTLTLARADDSPGTVATVTLPVSLTDELERDDEPDRTVVLSTDRS